MPLSEIIVLCGFFMIYLVEEVVHKLLSGNMKVFLVYFFLKCQLILKEHDNNLVEHGKENAGFRLDDKALALQKTHQHQHDEMPVELIGAEKTFQAKQNSIKSIHGNQITGKP